MVGSFPVVGVSLQILRGKGGQVLLGTAKCLVSCYW